MPEALKELLKQLSQIGHIAHAGHFADPGKKERVSSRDGKSGEEKSPYECIERIGAPMSTVRRPILDTSGPTG